MILSENRVKDLSTLSYLFSQRVSEKLYRCPFIIDSIDFEANLLKLAYILIFDQYFKYFFHDVVIIQYLFLIMIEDGLKDPDGIKYLFIEPFQLKSKFYPIFYFVLLTIGGVRADLLIPITLGLIIHFTNCSSFMTTLSEYLDSKFLNEKMINAGFLKTGSEQRMIKPMDELVTSDSVIL